MINMWTRISCDLGLLSEQIKTHQRNAAPHFNSSEEGEQSKKQQPQIQLKHFYSRWWCVNESDKVLGDFVFCVSRHKSARKTPRCCDPTRDESQTGECRGALSSYRTSSGAPGTPAAAAAHLRSRSSGAGSGAPVRTDGTMSTKDTGDAQKNKQTDLFLKEKKIPSYFPGDSSCSRVQKKKNHFSKLNLAPPAAQRSASDWRQAFCRVPVFCCCSCSALSTSVSVWLPVKRFQNISERRKKKKKKSWDVLVWSQCGSASNQSHQNTQHSVDFCV